MAQIIALCNFDNVNRVVELVRKLLTDDQCVPKACIPETLDFVKRALNLSALRGLEFTDGDLDAVEKRYRELLASDPAAVEDAMFTHLQTLRQETRTVLLDGTITGDNLGYGHRYFAALRSLGLVAMLWNEKTRNQFGSGCA